MAKGIRVRQLAKELGVESKVILEKAKAESMADPSGKAFAASSTLSLGAAETFRTWHAEGELNSLIEKISGTGASKKKVPAKRIGGESSDEGGGVATLEAEPPVVETRVAPVDQKPANPPRPPGGT